MASLLISTRNAHKVEEIRAILGADFNYHTLNQWPDAPPVQEDAPTFAGNATKKAVVLAQWIAARRPQLGSPAFVLADDSGLEVDALDGAPGVHSARFAAANKGSGNSSDAENCVKLLRLLQGVPPADRTARFRCVIALAPVPDGRAELFEGACEGRIGFEPKGQGGFGYDPLFLPLGYDETFAELGESVKNALSHRAKALAGVKNWFRANK